MTHWRVIWTYYAELCAVLDRVIARVEEVGDCLVWTGGFASATPVINRPAQTRLAAQGLGLAGYQVRVPQLLLELAGKWPLKSVGKTGGVSCTCSTVGCVAHAAYKSRSQINRAGRANMPKGARQLWCANVARNHAHRKLTEQQVQLIRSSPDVSASALAKACNVSRMTINDVRSGRTHRSYAASPWAGLGA